MPAERHRMRIYNSRPIAHRRYTHASAQRRRRPAASSDRGRGLIPIILLIAVAYFATAGWTGRMVAEKIIAPAMKAFSVKHTPEASPGPAASPDNTPGNVVGQQVSLAPFTLYAVQAGVFQNAVNADAMAASVAQQGGAGTVIRDSDGYHVVIAAYATDGDAATVINQLKNEGTAATHFPLQLEEVTISLTGSQTQAKAMEETLGVWRSVCLELGNVASVQAAGGNVLPAKADEFAGKLREAASGLAAADGDGLKAKAVEWASRLEAVAVMSGSGAIQSARKVQVDMAWDLIEWVGKLKR
nr:SPOR domain-containing protein [bacterium]